MSDGKSLQRYFKYGIMTLFLEMKMINDKRISDQIHSGSTPDFLEV